MFILTKKCVRIWKTKTAGKITRYVSEMAHCVQVHINTLFESLLLASVIVRNFRLDKCDPPQKFDAKSESIRTARLQDTLSVP